MLSPLHRLPLLGGLTANGIAWSIALFVLAFVVSIVLVGVLLVQLPATYFLDNHARSEVRHPVLRWTLRIVKNLLGAVLVALGIVMLVTPGQGILTVLVGVMLLEFPGKRVLERKLIARPKVLHAINHLRARYGKPPLVLEQNEDEPALPS